MPMIYENSTLSGKLTSFWRPFWIFDTKTVAGFVFFIKFGHRNRSSKKSMVICPTLLSIYICFLACHAICINIGHSYKNCYNCTFTLLRRVCCVGVCLCAVVFRSTHLIVRWCNAFFSPHLLLHLHHQILWIFCNLFYCFLMIWWK